MSAYFNKKNARKSTTKIKKVLIARQIINKDNPLVSNIDIRGSFLNKKIWIFVFICRY